MSASPPIATELVRRGELSRCATTGLTEQPDHRQRRLLCRRGERPRSYRTAEQRQELATLRLIELHPVTVRLGAIAG